MQALSEVLPSVAEKKVGRGGFMVLRPDSGEPVEAVLEALRAAEKVFGVDINSKGYKAGALLLVVITSTSSANLVSSFPQVRSNTLHSRKLQCVQRFAYRLDLTWAPDAWTLKPGGSNLAPSIQCHDKGPDAGA